MQEPKLLEPDSVITADLWEQEVSVGVFQTACKISAFKTSIVTTSDS